jgi:hypothetical protein
MVKDIAGNELKVGDDVYYARKSDYHANGELVRCKIKHIIDDSQLDLKPNIGGTRNVFAMTLIPYFRIGRELKLSNTVYKSKNPEIQVIKI